MFFVIGQDWYSYSTLKLIPSEQSSFTLKELKMQSRLNSRIRCRSMNWFVNVCSTQERCPFVYCTGREARSLVFVFGVEEETFAASHFALRNIDVIEIDHGELLKES